MTYDLNDAELPRGTDLIPDGTFVKVAMTIRPGGVDGQGEADRGLLKASQTPGSDVLLLDAEFTITAGPYVRRKFWQNFTVAGGKADEHRVSIGWNISKGMFRAMIDSALGLDPQDMSEAARANRILRALADLSGLTFAAKLRIEPANDPRYAASNRLERVVLPGEAEYQRIMDGEVVQAQPNTRGPRSPAQAVSPVWAAPVWSSPGGAPTIAPTATGTPPAAWERPAAAPVPQAPPTAAEPAADGPSWLKG